MKTNPVKLKPGLVASCDIRLVRERAYSGTGASKICHLLRHLPTYLQPLDQHGTASAKNTANFTSFKTVLKRLFSRFNFLTQPTHRDTCTSAIRIHFMTHDVEQINSFSVAKHSV